MASTKESNLDDLIQDVNEVTFSKPRISQEMAVDLMRRLYGLEVTEIKDMNSFADQNFHVKVSKEHRNPYIDQVSYPGYTLKVINTMKSSIEGHFDSMHTAVRYLNEKGTRVPVPVRNLEGETWQLETLPLLDKDENTSEEKKCGIYLYTYIPGTPIADIENTPETLFQWGVLLAKFHQALEDLDCSHLRSKQILSNIQFFSLIGKFMQSLDEDTKKLVTAVLDRYKTEVEEEIKNLPEGFIHGDFNDHNILARMKESDVKTYVADGILDFEDIHFGTYAWDLGLMLAHATLISTSLDPLESAGTALAGYRSVRRLSEAELSILKVFVECRICQTLVFCSYSAELDPENTYISNLTLTEPKCAMLELLSKTSSADLSAKWNDIYKNYCEIKT